MNNEISQIYHVSRCGSTLLTSLLSTVTTAYSEPSWSSSLLLGIDPLKNIKTFYGSVVKFPSMVSCFPTNFNGKKIFLYRPLAQHLCKMKSVDKNWTENRLVKVDYIYQNYNHPKIVGWIPKTKLEKITYLWVCSVFRMMDLDEVLWIKTNDFLINKKEILKLTCEHFCIPIAIDISISNINVKKSGWNAKDLPVGEVINKNELTIGCPFPSYGIIETDLSLYDVEIKDVVKMIENVFPELSNFLY